VPRGTCVKSTVVTGGHGVFIAEAEVDEVEDWYDPDNDWYDSDNNLQIPLFDVHGAQGISFQNLTGGPFLDRSHILHQKYPEGMESRFAVKNRLLTTWKQASFGNHVTRRVLQSIIFSLSRFTVNRITFRGHVLQ
jgi:hypothetical protein